MKPEERKANGVAANITADEWRRRLNDTDKLDPTVPITLKNKEYTLEFNNRAIKRVLRDTGHNVIKDGIDRDALNDPNLYGSLVLHGLETHHPDLTEDEVDMLVTYRHFFYISSQLLTALSLFMPDVSDVLEAPGPDAGEAKPEDPI